MSISLQVLDLEGLNKRIAELKAHMKRAEVAFRPVEQLKSAFACGDRAERNGWCDQGSFLRNSLELARLQHAAGCGAPEVRETLKNGTDVYSPLVPLFDYSPFDCQFAVPKSQAKRFEGGEIPHDLNRVLLAPNPSLGPNYVTVQVKVKRQPAQIEMKEALVSALVAWDFASAHFMAESYKLQPAVPGAGPSHFGLLRETILGRIDAALEQLANIPDGYNSDFPPNRRELAEGVIKRDSALIHRGAKAISTRFKTAWTLKIYCTTAKLKRYGSLDKMLPDIRNHLMWHKWLMADWAVAWMSLAWHLGIRDAFSDRDLFNEWLPRNLCCPDDPESERQRQRPTNQNLAIKQGKRALTKALFDAVIADNAEEITHLVGLGADLEARNMEKLTPLLSAVAKQKEAAALALIDGGADFSATDLKQQTALSIAAEAGLKFVVAALIHKGASPDSSDRPATPLILAIQFGKIEVAKLLVDMGAQVSKSDWRNWRTPLSAAIEKADLPLVDFLLSHGADPNAPLGSHLAPLFIAAKTADCTFTSTLVASGADSRAQSSFSLETPLHHAVEEGSYATTEFLIKAGAFVDAPDRDKETPLHRAADRGNPAFVKLLIESGGNVNAVTNAGETPVMVAARFPDCLQVLIEAGADLSSKNHLGETVRILAKDYPESLRVLAMNS